MENKNPKLRVALFEDNDALRDVLSQVINDHPQLECSGAFSEATQLDALLADSKPDVIVMDIDLPRVNGIEATRRIKQSERPIPVLILTVFEDEVKIFNAICAGAEGYLLKNTTPDKIIDSILDIAQGGSPMSPLVARKVLETFKDKNISIEKKYDLSARELEVLNLLTQGLSYKLIAAKCFISIDTVKFHAKNIYEKLQVHSKSEAVIVALKHRLVD
ncbi:MAG: response regulator [Flavobacteriales bacterium]